MDDEARMIDRIEYGPPAAPGDATPMEADVTRMPLPGVTADAAGWPPVGEATALPQGVLPTVHMGAPAEATEVTVATVIEALLFAADRPLSIARLGELAGGCSAVQIRLHVAALNDKYAAAGLSFRIEAIAHGYQMLTLPRFQPWLTRLNQQRAQTRLSAAALEALAVVAYKQPVIRAEIEAIRGVACGDVLNRLRELGLIRIVGRAEVVGRPLLYGTTRKFLDAFGLADLNDLPPMEALSLRRLRDRTEEDSPPAAELPLAASA